MTTSRQHYIIDWEKVKTLDDLKRIFAAMHIGVEPDCMPMYSIKDLVRLEGKEKP